MVPTGIRKRLISNYLVVIAIIVVVMGSFFIWFLHNLYMQTLRDSLSNQARLTLALMAEMRERDAAPAELDQRVKEIGQELGLRVTLVAGDGVVLADSADDPQAMDNHLERPEIQQAILTGKGVASRYSITLDENMLYLAMPLYSSRPAGDLTAVVRLAVPLVHIRQAVSNLLKFTLAALLFASMVALASAVVLSRRITEPIETINRAAHAISQGNFTPGFEVRGSDELSALADSIREMGKVIETKLEQLVMEKNKLETIMSSMSSGIVVVDDEMRVELINPAAEQLFDVERNHIIGTSLAKALRHYALYQNVRAVREDGRERRFELDLYYPKTMVLDTHLLPIHDVEGAVKGMLLLFHEVTHLRSLEKMRSDFVANVSHELRTPLTTTRGYTETILHEELTPEQVRGFLEIIDRETLRLSKLLDDLLDLAEIENEKGYVKKEVVSLSSLLREAVERVDGLRQQKQVSIEIFGSKEGPNVLANPEWLSQALANILENSIRHGYERGRVMISLYEQAQDAVVEIADNGPGIPETDLPYIFERFYRVDKARSRRSGGTGLGLSIVKHIMEAHDAVYTLENRAEGGTVFRFSLPLHS